MDRVRDKRDPKDRRGTTTAINVSGLLQALRGLGDLPPSSGSGPFGIAGDRHVLPLRFGLHTAY
jgi:hypothetical protein